MLSDNQHIDDFFRKKEEAFAPDNLPVESNWQQFKTRLSEQGDGFDKRSPGNTRITRLLGFLVVATVVLVAINPFRHGKKKTTATAKQQATVAIKTVRQVRPGTSPDSLPAGIHPTEVPDKVPAPIKPVHEQGPILIGAVPVAPVVPNKGNDTVESSGPDATKLLQSFFQQLEKPTQEFFIDNTHDTTIIAKEGSRLFVPANALIAKAGPVKIIVREYYKYEDIIAAKLTTTSNGEQLITGGMLHISAEQNGDTVVIAPQKSITVSMPTEHWEQLVIDIVDMATEKVQAATTTTLPNRAGNVKVLKRDSFNYIKQEKLQSRYNFVISNMGWVNYDCFRNAPQPRTDLIVNLGNEMNFTSCSAQLVCSRHQSVISPYFGYGHTIQFKFLPTGDQAVLVLVAVKNGELVSSFVPFTISDKEITDLPFEPTTPAAFKQKLQSLFAPQKQ